MNTGGVVVLGVGAGVCDASTLIDLLITLTLGDSMPAQYVA